MSLTLLDFSDRELLHIVYTEAEASEDGYVSSLALADVLGLPKKDRHRTSSVGSRLGAMRRFGVVEKMEGRHPSRWRTTEVGNGLVFGKLDDQQNAAVSQADPAQLLLLTRFIANIRKSESARHLMRREWTRETKLYK